MKIQIYKLYFSIRILNVIYMYTYIEKQNKKNNDLVILFFFSAFVFFLNAQNFCLLFFSCCTIVFCSSMNETSRECALQKKESKPTNNSEMYINSKQKKTQRICCDIEISFFFFVFNVVCVQ